MISMNMSRKLCALGLAKFAIRPVEWGKVKENRLLKCSYMFIKGSERCWELN